MVQSPFSLPSHRDTMRTLFAACTSLALFVAPAFAQSSAVVGFDGGSPDGFTGNFFFEATGGNPDGNAHLFLQTFFPMLQTGGVGGPVNPSFIGDYSTFAEVTFRMDVRTTSITNFFGGEIERPLGIALVDRDVQGPSGSSGVFFEFAALSAAAQANWTELSVTIGDTTSAALPAGWIGFGDEDPMTFEPILPAGATFASVLAGVDEVRITGAVPGFFFNNANYDVRIDNVAVVATLPSLGDEVCAGEPNSTGLGADLRLTGSDVAGDNALIIEVTSLPPSTPGYFIHSEGTNVIQNPGGSQGILCIGSNPVGRFSSNVLNSGSAGTVSFSPDLTMLPLPMGTVAAVAGETRYFQYWYRDVVGGMNTSNFSSAEGVTLQ